MAKSTLEDLRVVCAFFSIDLDNNAHIFRHAADNHGDAFAKAMADLAAAVRTDCRYGIAQRIRATIAERKTREGC